MRLFLQQQHLPTGLLRPSLLRPLYRSLRAAGRIADVDPDAETSILLTNDEGIALLNSQFRGIDRPTDVLSFPQEDDLLLGDIVISMETAQRQAARADWPFSSEVALLGVHGLLHLLGWDDESLEGAQEMETFTRTVLTASQIDMPGDEHPFFRSFLEQ